MKPVHGQDGRYSVSEDGKVWSHLSGRYLKTFVNNSGYEIVRLSSDGKLRHHLVHRLVAEAFIPQIAGKAYVNHIDRDKTNNVAVNLEWVTFQENIDHAVAAGNYGRRRTHDIEACICPCHRRSQYIRKSA